MAWVSGGSPFAPTEGMLSLVFAPTGDMLNLILGELFWDLGLSLRDCNPFSGSKKKCKRFGMFGSLGFAWEMLSQNVVRRKVCEGFA